MHLISQDILIAFRSSLLNIRVCSFVYCCSPTFHLHGYHEHFGALRYITPSCKNSSLPELSRRGNLLQRPFIMLSKDAPNSTNTGCYYEDLFVLVGALSTPIMKCSAKKQCMYFFIFLQKSSKVNDHGIQTNGFAQKSCAEPMRSQKRFKNGQKRSKTHQKRQYFAFIRS